MTLEEKTHLASIEILFPSGAINARWDTEITRDGVPIAPPSHHRKAYGADNLIEIQQEIEEVLNKDYLRIAGELATQKELLHVATVERDGALQQIEHLHSSYGARITELEEAVRAALFTIQEQAVTIQQLQQVPSEPLVQEANTAATD